MNNNEEKPKQSILEKLQPLFGVTRNELIFTSTIFIFTCIAFIVRVINKPEDTYDTKLNKDIHALFDSVATADSLRLFATADTTQKFDSAEVLQPLLFHPEHQYKKKELPTSIININKAGKEELMKLPGVGEKMAEKIVLYRSSQQFRLPEDLMNVSGIGEKKYEKMKPFISVK